MKNHSIGLLLAALAPTLWMPNAKTQDLNLPEEIANKIEAILEVKREAMRFPGMRPPQSNGIGIFGRRAEPLMDELAAMVADPALVAEFEKAEATDIRAKIALWALDRKERPKEYARFEEWYVNRPAYGENAVDYFYRPYKGTTSEFLASQEPSYFVPRVGTWRPNEIDDEDRIEENRRIMEYCFFMPPTGRGFDNDLYRHNIVMALVGMDHNERSLIVFVHDCRFYSDTEDTLHGRRFEGRNNESALALSLIPGNESFKSLSHTWTILECRIDIEHFFNRIWKKNWPIRRSDADLRAHRMQWMELANREWLEPHEREFAKWLKTVPAPIPPPPVNLEN